MLINAQVLNFSIKLLFYRLNDGFYADVQTQYTTQRRRIKHDKVA